MMTKVFQIEVTSRRKAGRQIFAVEAGSQMYAEKALSRDSRVPHDPIFNLMRMLSAGEIAQHGLQCGSIAVLK